jgi:hypothetical protein
LVVELEHSQEKKKKGKKVNALAEQTVKPGDAGCIAKLQRVRQKEEESRCS